jgi:hypothetical protein
MTLPTLYICYSPQALKKDCSKGHIYGKPKMDKKITDTIYHTPDRDWKYDLNGCFEIVAIDKAHVTKNIDTAGYSTLEWLGADYYILASIQIVSNRIGNYYRIGSLIRPRPSLITDENLATWNFNKNKDNPYNLNNDNPAYIF